MAGSGSPLRVSLILVALLFMLSFTSGSWQGFWTDESRGYNKGMACCLFGTTLNCLYSELGIVSGTLTEGGQVAVGEWIQASENGAKCGRGNFSLTLASDKSSFSGFYTCRNSTKRIPWQERVIESFRQPTEEQCGALLDSASTATMNGRWGDGIDELQDVCIYSSDLRSEVSYQYNGLKTKGFLKAIAYIGSRVLNGRFRENYNRGVELLFAARNGSLARLFWTTDPSDPVNIKDYRNPARHRYYYINRGANATASPGLACITSRNIEYLPRKAVPPDNVNAATTTVAASLVLVGLLALLAAAAF